MVTVGGFDSLESEELRVITEGFFGPLFFVWLGASLHVRELGERPQFIALGVALGLGAVLAHCVGRLMGQPLALAALAAAQLGVPVAAATVGTEEQLLLPGEASALILGALITVAVTSAPAGWPPAIPGLAPRRAPERHDHHGGRGQRQRRGDGRRRRDTGIESGTGGFHQARTERRRQVVGHRDRAADALMGVGRPARG